MTSVWPKIDRILLVIGRGIGSTFIGILCLTVLLAFPVTDIVASFAVGFGVAFYIGGGGLVLFPSAFLFGLFLSIYVWIPYVREPIRRCIDVLMSWDSKKRNRAAPSN